MDALNTERDMLKRLSREPSIPSPRLLGEGIFADRIPWPYLVIEYLPGERLDTARTRIERSNYLAIVRQLGSMVRHFSDLDLESLPFIERPQRSWRETFAAGRLETCEDLRQNTRLATDLRHMVIDYIQDHQFAAWLDEPPVLYHSDLEPEHVLLIETKGRWAISGLIDYANTQTGLREFDLKEVYAHLVRKFYRPSRLS